MIHKPKQWTPVLLAAGWIAVPNGVLLAAMVALGVLAGTPQAAQAGRPGWNRREVNWRISRGLNVRAVHYPEDKKPPTLDAKRRERENPPPGRSRSFGAMAESAVVPAGAPVYVYPIDSPPIDGFVPWLAVLATDARLGALEMHTVPQNGLVGDFRTPTPETDYAIGILDSGASTHLMGNEAAARLGLFSGSPDLITPFEVEIQGATGSAFAWVSEPLGIFVDGLDAIDPTTLELDPGQFSSMLGGSNVAMIVGEDVPPGGVDLPTALGMPLMIYRDPYTGVSRRYTAVIYNNQQATINRDGHEYTGPVVDLFWDPDDPEIPDYTDSLSLQLRPAGGTSVDYFPCIEVYPGDCPSGGADAPQYPSFVSMFSYALQSLYFIPDASGVDLYDNGRSSIANDAFILDTGAQITVVGSGVASRLALNPNLPDFEVEVQGANGETTLEPGFYLDLIEIPTLGEWLSFTNVPVVYLDVASPEGGSLDGIIGMNLFVEYNLVLRGGGLSGMSNPELRYKRLVFTVDADFDDDGDVDQADFGHLQQCYSGYYVPQMDQDCQDVLLDFDTDVDAEDFDLFQACASGPGVAAAPNCLTF